MPETDRIRGLVIKSYCGYFLVHTRNKVYRCKARGKVGTSQVLVGDYVDIVPVGVDEAVIEQIEPRSLQLKKPPVANVDQVVLVFSVQEPELDVKVIDRFILLVAEHGLPSALCINKTDLADKAAADLRQTMNVYSKIGFPVVFVSALQPEGIEDLKKVLHGHISVFMGPSGVGKSSILNSLGEGLSLRVGDVSQKIGRGKHTTRFAELIQLDPGTWVVDTPGFSFIEHTVTSKELAEYFPEIRSYGDQCRFANCLHLHEPGCAVKEAVENGEIAGFRYNSYCQVLEELLNKERNKYK